MFDENYKIINNNNNLKTEEDNSKSDDYYIMVQMNSTEIDYQFLVNALFYWEEKYPTELSKYKFESYNIDDENKDKDKDKEKKEEDKDIKFNFNHKIIPENKYNVKLFNYFMTEKPENKSERGKTIFKMTKLYRIIDDKLEKTRKNLEIFEKAYKDPKTKEEDKQKNLESFKIFKKNQKYYQKI